MKCSEMSATTEKLCPSASSGRVFSTSSSVSAIMVERNRWSISFQPGTSTVFPLAVNSFPAQENTAVTVSYSWGAAIAQSSLEQTRFISLHSLSARPVKPCFTNSDVGMMAWWSDTFLLFRIRPTFGGQVKSLGKGQQPQQIRHKMLYRLAHVLGQILAVRAGIGQQFLFVKLLGIIKGLLCRKSEQAVCFPLQGGQVIELGRLFCLFLPFDRSTNGSCACAFFFERIQSWKIPPFFDYGKGRQHFLLSPLDYPPARTDGAVNGGRSPFTCR